MELHLGHLPPFIMYSLNIEFGFDFSYPTMVAFRPQQMHWALMV